MKRVLIVGQTLELGRTEEVYGRGFLAAGCEVQYFTWKEAAPSLFSGAIPDRVAWRVAWQWMAQPANQQLQEMAARFQPDLTLVVSPLLMQPDSIRAIQRCGLAFVFFTDNPLDAHHTHSNVWVRRGLPLWDAALIWSQELVRSLQQQGLTQVVFHPFCSDVEFHFPQRQPCPIYDVAFIGNWDASRKREQYLQAIAQHRLGIWGSNYWNTHCQEPALQGLCQGICSYAKIPEVLGSAKMGLNILRPQNEEGHNIRTFEIPATGTLMLSERSPVLLDLFIEDREAVYFSSPEELNQKVDYLLQHESLMQTIAEAGYQRSLKHRIGDRIKEIDELYKQLKPVQKVLLRPDNSKPIK